MLRVIPVEMSLWLLKSTSNLSISIPLPNTSVAFFRGKETEPLSGRSLRSKSKPTKFKCIGPLQIKYQYWCPNEKGEISVVKADGLVSKCDPYFHGVRALKYYVKKFKPLTKALCYYNNSKKCKKTYKSGYVKGVLKHLNKIKTIMVKDKYKPLR